MDPAERARRIRSIATDPRTLKLHAQHESLVSKLMEDQGKAMDSFIKRFLLRHFPYAVQDRIAKFGAAAVSDITGAVEALHAACGITYVGSTELHGTTQVRVAAFHRNNEELCRLEIFFTGGKLYANEYVAKKGADSPMFGYDVPAVRLFFWRLCQSTHAPLADLSRRHYAIRFGCEPEPTMESINFDTRGYGGFSDQDPQLGEQQRPEPDRG